MRKCLLIPGNPVVADDYKSWIQEIESQNNDVSIVYATSYVLFDRKLNYMEYDRSMFEHYEKLFLELNSSTRITIIAHSVGSYFALKLLEKYPEKIERVIIMFPYIGYSTIKPLRLIWPLYFIDRFFPLAEMVARCKNLFKKWYGVQNISSYDLTACLRFGVRQCTYFNKYKLDINPVSKNKEKIYFIYKKNDRWCPQSTIELLKPISAHKEVDIPHDFIISKNERQRMTREVGDYLLNTF